jgi:hypothetical protein
LRDLGVRGSRAKDKFKKGTQNIHERERREVRKIGSREDQ